MIAPDYVSAHVFVFLFFGGCLLSSVSSLNNHEDPATIDYYDVDTDEENKRTNVDEMIRALFHKPYAVLAPNDDDNHDDDDDSDYWTEETIEYWRQHTVVGAEIKEFHVPMRKKVSGWTLSDGVTSDQDDGITLISSPADNNANYMLSKQALPEDLFDSAGKTDWEMFLHLTLRLDKIITEDAENPQHDVALILGSKDAIDSFIANDFKLRNFRDAAALTVRARISERNDNQTFLYFHWVYPSSDYLFLAHDAIPQGVCMLPFSSRQSYFEIETEMHLSKYHEEAVMHLAIGQASCGIAAPTDFRYTSGDMYVAIQAWARNSLDKLMVREFHVITKEKDEKNVTDSESSIKDDQDYHAAIHEILASSVTKDSHEEDEEHRLANNASYEIVNMKDEEYYHFLLDKFDLDFPIDDTVWALRGSAEVHDGNRLMLNSQSRHDNVSGFLVSKVALPNQKRSWQLDLTFKMSETITNKTSNLRGIGHIVLKLVGTELADIILEKEQGDEMDKQFSQAVTRSPWLYTQFLLKTENEDASVLIEAKSSSKGVQEYSRQFREENCHSSIPISVDGPTADRRINETGTISLRKFASGAVQFVIEWWQDLENHKASSSASSPHHEPICRRTFDFSKDEWPFEGDMDPIYVIVASPALKLLTWVRHEVKTIDIEITSLSVSPFLPIEAETAPKPPTFANDHDVKVVEVPLCAEHSSTSHCLLDCSTRLTNPSTVNVWFRKPIDLPGQLQMIRGAEGLAVLQMRRIVTLKPGDEVICLARNRYGSSRRTFLITGEDYAGWLVGGSKLLKGWQGALLYFGGIFTVAMIGVGVAAWYFIRTRLAKRRAVADSYSLLQRADIN